MLDYGNLSFISAQNPYVALDAIGQSRPQPRPRADVEFYVYGWSRRVLYSSGRDAPPLTEDGVPRAYASRDAVLGDDRPRVELARRLLPERSRRHLRPRRRRGRTAFGHLVAEAELARAGVRGRSLPRSLGGMLFNLLVGRAPASGRALLARSAGQLLSQAVPRVRRGGDRAGARAGAGVARTTWRTLMLDGHRERGDAHWRRVGQPRRRGLLQRVRRTSRAMVDDDLVVWLSRVDRAGRQHLRRRRACWRRASATCLRRACCRRRTPGEVYRAILLDGRPVVSSAARRAGGLEYLIAADAGAARRPRGGADDSARRSRQQETQAQIDELDRRVLLAAVLFIMLGAGIGYYMAERIADPVNRLMRATRRIARGDLDARVLATSSDELRRLVDAFNQMADDLQRQRGELERTNRLAAWADMARQVAHDIKNPLTPIQLNAEHLRRVHVDQGRPLGGVIDECVANILGQVRLLRQISSEFSSFASSPEPRPVDTSLAELVERSGRAVSRGTGRPRRRSRRTCRARCRTLLIDRMLIGRALTNIIENALHAMPGGGTLTIDAALGAGSQGAAARHRYRRRHGRRRAREDLRAVLLDEGDRHRPRPDDCEAQRRSESAERSR